MTKKEKISFQYDSCLFERLNSKYNRLWEQITSLSILCIEIFAGYSFAILAIDTSRPELFVKMSYVTLIIFIIIVGLACAIGRLEYEKIDTKRGLLQFVKC